MKGGIQLTRVQEGDKLGNPVSVLRMTEEDKINKILELQSGSQQFECNSSINQVEYGSTDLSQEAICYRRKNNITGTRNIAVFEYENNGLHIITGGSQRNQGHAERLLAKKLENMGIQPAHVKRIYSELEPCSIPGGYCKQFLQKVFPQADITYSFEYGLTKESRSTGLKALKEAVKKLFNTEDI